MKLRPVFRRPNITRWRTEEVVADRYARMIADACDIVRKRDKLIAVASTVIDQAREELRKSMQARLSSVKHEMERRNAGQTARYRALRSSLEVMLARWERCSSGDTTSHMAELREVITRDRQYDVIAGRSAAS